MSKNFSSINKRSSKPAFSVKTEAVLKSTPSKLLEEIFDATSYPKSVAIKILGVRTTHLTLIGGIPGLNANQWILEATDSVGHLISQFTRYNELMEREKQNLKMGKAITSGIFKKMEITNYVCYGDNLNRQEAIKTAKSALASEEKADRDAAAASMAAWKTNIQVPRPKKPEPFKSKGKWTSFLTRDQAASEVEFEKLKVTKEEFDVLLAKNPPDFRTTTGYRIEALSLTADSAAELENLVIRSIPTLSNSGLQTLARETLPDADNAPDREELSAYCDDAEDFCNYLLQIIEKLETSTNSKLNLYDRLRELSLMHATGALRGDINVLMRDMRETDYMLPDGRYIEGDTYDERRDAQLDIANKAASKVSASATAEEDPLGTGPFDKDPDNPK